MKPVVFVHGFLDTWYTPWWKKLGKRAREACLLPDMVRFVEKGSVPGMTVGSPEEYAELVRAEVEKAHDSHDSRVNVVGHSMGGLDARVYIEEMGGKELVDSLVTLGTPHQGTLTSWLASFTPGGRALRMSSDLIKRRPTEVVDDVEYVSVWSPSDALVKPTKNARMRRDDKENVTNVRVGSLGHLELTKSKAVFSKYSDLLCE